MEKGSAEVDSLKTAGTRVRKLLTSSSAGGEKSWIS
jgi:hypothetical protein